VRGRNALLSGTHENYFIKNCTQIALLYTSVSGQRRLRLHNINLSVCAQLSDMYRCCETDVILNYFAKKAVK